MALLLILGAMAEQRYPTSSGESLDQAQRKLLAMVLNSSAALVDRAIKEELLSVFAGELGPRDFAILDGG